MAKVVGFVGLGAMGYPMAGHLAKAEGMKCLVWNRTTEKAKAHSQEYGSEVALNFEQFSEAQVVMMCLPTSAEDKSIVEAVVANLPTGACIVSCTSGEPAATRELSIELKARGVHFVDSPVSGGPKGAQAGTLTSMLGAESDEVAEKVLPYISAYSKKVVRCGPVGSGMAVKAVNNALNVTHLLLGAEGLLALQNFGVDPEVALDAINGASGRSLQTQERLPQEVLTRKFGYGFKLSLMAKDCRIANGLLKDLPGSSLLPRAIELVQEATETEGGDADYSRAVCLLEKKANMELHPGDPAARQS